MADKFLYIKEGKSDGTLLAEDGGVAIIWHNDEHLIAQCYRERLEQKNLQVSFSHAFEQMNNVSFNSALIDFDEEDELILPSHIEEMADWLMSSREGNFVENLIVLDGTEENYEEQIKKFLSKIE